MTTLAIRPALHATDARNQSLALLARSGDIAARNELIEANVAIAYREALSFSARRGHDPDDAIGFALLTLVECAARYDADRAAFSTFAIRSIRLALRRHGIDDRLIHLPNYLFSSGAKRDPDAVAAAESIRSMRFASLSNPCPGGAPDSYFAVAAPADDPAGWGERRDEWARLDGMLRTLPSNEREAIERRFGLGASRQPETFAGIAAGWGVTRERVRQVYEAGMQKLRAMGGMTHATDTTRDEGNR